MRPTGRKSTQDEEVACQHCGALAYRDARVCRQCGKFPVALHRCPHCGFIAPADAERCERCGRVFMPGGDYL
jgi:RNA polymerase subunit RPABC4/transcription elongation factor Spt4